ncbi:MAG: type II toxin-antitoxin system VapC family toxin [Kiritimatiellae bacterium]|nr:type II toxin-antitoxin system VapC family toxin [Kiritimatiellia bacterium]
MKALFDTNILIDYVNGSEAARHELDRYDTRLISIITYIEVMVGAKNASEEKKLEGFLATFTILDLTTPISQKTIAIRRTFKLKIPDAIVYATAKIQGCILISRNTKDFKTDWPDIRVPY